MKLRTQFFILVGGVIAVPLLVTVFMLFVQNAIERGREPFTNYRQINAWMHREVPLALRKHEFASLMRDRPAGFDVIILDKNDTVSLSTVPELAAGMQAMGPAFMGYIRNNIDRYHFQIDTFSDSGGGDSLIILKAPRMRPEEQRLRNLAFSFVMYPSIALMIFSSLMSFLILRSINTSILTLEGATRRVAEGDLDFNLPARGNDRIASLTRSFDSMRRALKEEYARRARFIMGVSHDLRTPLTLIQGYVEAISDGYASDPEAQKRYLSIILDKTRGLESMVAELIEFVRMETGQWRMTHRDVPIRQFLMEMARRFAEDALILKRDFGWSIDVPDDVTIRMDAALVTRAMENLVGNAIRYTEERGKISLSAHKEDGEVRLAISDTGIGIPKEDLSRIFDPFYRGTNSRRESGFGLGLTTVKSIIESHGWTICVSSQVDLGSTFTISMPISPKGTT